MNKNYYTVLGITELSTDSEIKTAYRKLARKYHPDIAGSSDENVKRFKEINEAYEILSDKKRREEYNTARRFYNYSSKSTAEAKKSYQNVNNTTKPNFKEYEKRDKTTSAEKKSGFAFNWEEFISKYKETDCKQKENKSVTRGKDIYTELDITVAEALNGTSKIINMLQTQVCPKCKGRKFVNGNACSECKGKGEISEYKRFTVKIPSGIKDNSKIRLAGEGEKSLLGGKNGDLYITIHVKAPINYTTDGLNILRTVTLTPSEAVLGGDITIPTNNNGNITVKINPYTGNGQKIRVNGCGINDGKKSGDLILTVEIQIPKFLSKEEIELYKKLRELAYLNTK